MTKEECSFRRLYFDFCLFAQNVFPHVISHIILLHRPKPETISVKFLWGQRNGVLGSLSVVLNISHSSLTGCKEFRYL